MSKLSQEKIMEIRQGVDIIEIISEYIPLTQKGRNYFGVCPFHQDHSPSMSVSSEKQMFKCFSCGMAGNVFKFVSEFENITYFEAIKKIALKIGIPVDVGKASFSNEKYASDYETMNLAMLYFKNNLNTSSGSDAKQYLLERGLDEQTIVDFDIGLSLDKNRMFEFFQKKNVSADFLEKLGLVSQNGIDYQDVFRSRIIFPIHDARGHVIGFIGRVYKDNMGPKYLNSKETHIFRKGNVLFNYHRAKEEVRVKKYLILVEGNMDAIRLYSSGIKNVVALQGTSLTKEHIQLISNLRVPVILMLDNDEAGANATLLNGNLLEDAHIKVEVVRLSGEKDPDEYIVKNGIRAMKENLSSPISFLEFKMQLFKKNKNLNDSMELADYVKSVLETLEGKDEITIDIALNKLSSDYHLSYDVLKSQLKQNTKEILPISTFETPQKQNRTSRYRTSVQHILYYMMNDSKYIQMYKSSLGFFQEEAYRGVANEILYYFEKNKKIYLADFLDYAEESPLKDTIYNIIEGINQEELEENSMRDFLYIVKENQLKSKMQDLKKEQKDTNDIVKKEKIGEQIVGLMKQIQEMKIERSV